MGLSPHRDPGLPLEGTRAESLNEPNQETESWEPSEAQVTLWMTVPVKRL